MPNTGLTPPQAKLLAFIERAMLNASVPPTFEEMRVHMGFASKAAVAGMVDELEQRGMVSRPLEGRARSICIRRRILCPHCGNIAASDACVAAAGRAPAVTYSASVLSSEGVRQ